MPQERVVFVQSHPALGSTEVYFADLIAGVKGTSTYDVSVVVPRATSEWWRETLPDSVPVEEYTSSTLWELFQALATERRSIVHVNEPAPKVLAAATMSASSKVFVTHHTPSLPVEFNWKGRLLTWLTFRSGRLRFIVTCETNRERLVSERGIPVRRTHVVPPGIDLSRFRRPMDKADARDRLRLDRSVFAVASVARLAPQKRHDVLLRAVARVHEVVDGEVILLLAGNGPLEDELKVRSRRLGIENSVRFLGYRADVRPVLYAADLFCLSSDFEGLPFAMLEAMAAGLPVVCTSVDGMKDVVTPDMGELVPPDAPGALAAQLVKMSRDRHRLSAAGAKAREKAWRQHSNEQMVTRTLRLYDSVT